jgi:O-antigen ligase/polysaccharide polymerase Wzy-like membrane protein
MRRVGAPAPIMPTTDANTVTPERSTTLARQMAQSFLRFVPSRARTVVADGTRIGWAAAFLAFLLLAAAVAAARVFTDDFPAVVFIAALVVAAIGIFQPYVALLAAILLSPTFGWATVGPDISPFQVVVAGAAIGCLPALRSQSFVRRIVTRPEIGLAILFMVWVLIAAIVRSGSSNWGFVRNYVGALIFLGVAAITLRTARRRRYAVGALVVGTTATAGVGLVQIFTTEALVSAWVVPHLGPMLDTYERLGSPWGLATVGSDYGKDVLVGFLVLVPLILTLRGGSSRFVLVLPAVVLAIALAMSGSRSAWLAAAVALLYVAIVSRRLAISAPLVAIVGVLVFLIFRPATPVDVQAAFGLPDQGYQGRTQHTEAEKRGESPALVIGGTKDQLTVEASNKLRARLTRAGLGMVRDEPVFGVGAGAFRSYVDSYEPIHEGEAADSRRRLSAHNVPLEIWAGSGTPALLFYLGFIGAVLRRLHRSRSDEPGLYTGLTAATLGLVITSLFHNYQYDNLIWALCGIAASIAVYQRPTASQPMRAAPRQ